MVLFVLPPTDIGPLGPLPVPPLNVMPVIRRFCPGNAVQLKNLAPLVMLSTKIVWSDTGGGDVTDQVL
jgi:hypothetical protein